MYSRMISDEDRGIPAAIKVDGGSCVVYVEAMYVTPAQEDRDTVMMIYSRKQALKLAWVLLVASIRAFRRFR